MDQIKEVSSNKHNLVIIILVVLLIGSLSFSIFVMASDGEEDDSDVDATNYKSELERLNSTLTQLQQEQQQLQQEKQALAHDLKTEEEKSEQIFHIEKDSPFDHVKDNQVKVMKSKVEIDMKDVSWWTIADTNSMDPLIDIGSTALSITPKTEADVHQGDVAFYNSLIAEKVIIHRVIETNEDSEGWYSKFKGDNLKEIDPENVRFPQVEGVLIGVIY